MIKQRRVVLNGKILQKAREYLTSVQAGVPGALLRANHSESKTTQYLCGVETTPYQGDQATDMYDHWVDGDLTDSKVWEYLIQQEIDFDLVFAIGLPPAVIKSLTQNTMLKHLISRGGRLVILTDFYLPENLNQESGWRIYSGDAYIDKHVAIYQKNSGEKPRDYLG